ERAAHVVDDVAVGIGDDLVVQRIRVDADQAERLDVQPGLLADLADQRLPHRLARLHSAAGESPAPGVVATLEQHAALLEDHRRHPRTDRHAPHCTKWVGGWQRDRRRVSAPLMIPADETFDGTWPFAARYHHVPGAN